jgi:hypothetical protein
MMCAEGTAVYSEKHTNPVNTLFAEMRSYWTLNPVAHTVSAVLHLPLFISCSYVNSTLTSTSVCHCIIHVGLLCCNALWLVGRYRCFWRTYCFHLQHCRWRQSVCAKCWCLPTSPPDVTTIRTATVVRTSNLKATSVTWHQHTVLTRRSRSHLHLLGCAGWW